MCCAAVEILAPYIEFEYGHRLAPERFWKSRPSAAQKGDSSSSGPNANFLEIMYMQVALPEDPHYNPQMGCRVRDTAKVASLLPGNSAVEAALDPIADQSYLLSFRYGFHCSPTRIIYSLSRQGSTSGRLVE